MSQRFLVSLSLAFLATLSVPAAADLVFSAPPRETQSGGADSYAPLAQYLSKVTGQKVEYKYSDNWLSYQKEMQKGTYDLVFDGPHFVGWRMAKLGHVPLVKFPGNLSFVVIVKKNDNRFNSITQLAGRTICAHAPPNLATLTLLYEFKNPSRQPFIIDTQGFPAAYKGVVSGKCVAAILQAKLAVELDKEAQATRVIYQSDPLPNQTLSAGPRVSPEMQQKISRALLSEPGKAAAGALLERFKMKEFVPASSKEYNGLGVLLQDVRGFEQ
jgi:ABC-type phosphate/phosphonate transport system substrate-binding protein